MTVPIFKAFPDTSEPFNMGVTVRFGTVSIACGFLR